MNLILRPASVIGLILLVICSLVIFPIKYKVQNLRKELNQLDKEIVQTQEDIHILKAEWSYLTQPDSISKLAKRKLNLSAVDSTRIKSLKIDELYKLFDEKNKNENPDQTT